MPRGQAGDGFRYRSTHPTHNPASIPRKLQPHLPVTGGIVYESNGVITIPEENGLGATIDEKWLNKLEKVIV